MPEDQPFAVRMIGQLWEAHGYDDYDDASLAARAGEIMEHCECYVIGDPPVAFASLQEQGDYKLVRHFSVEADQRGQGVGRAAFEALEAHAFPGRRSRLYASTDLEGPKAFWEKMGYKIFAYTMERKGGEA
jgi:GNAT superfamily N-acetyltransferase